MGWYDALAVWIVARIAVRLRAEAAIFSLLALRIG